MKYKKPWRIPWWSRYGQDSRLPLPGSIPGGESRIPHGACCGKNKINKNFSSEDSGKKKKTDKNNELRKMTIYKNQYYFPSLTIKKSRIKFRKLYLRYHQKNEVFSKTIQKKGKIYAL